MTREAINELKKYTLGKKNTEKVEISVLQIKRVIKALEQEPCEDLINRKELDKALYERFHEEDSPNNITVVFLGEVRNFIKNFPSTINPQEPKTGRWTYTTHYGEEYRVCSECNAERKHDFSTGWNYCPCCGAKMR